MNAVRASLTRRYCCDRAHRPSRRERRPRRPDRNDADGDGRPPTAATAMRRVTEPASPTWQGYSPRPPEIRLNSCVSGGLRQHASTQSAQQQPGQGTDGDATPEWDAAGLRWTQRDWLPEPRRADLGHSEFTDAGRTECGFQWLRSGWRSRPNRRLIRGYPRSYGDCQVGGLRARRAASLGRAAEMCWLRLPDRRLRQSECA